MNESSSFLSSGLREMAGGPSENASGRMKQKIGEPTRRNKKSSRQGPEKKKETNGNVGL